MRRFVFRLERLLKLREEKEREQARGLGRALRREEEHQLQRSHAEGNLSRCANQIAEGMRGVVSAGTMGNLRIAFRAAAEGVEEANRSLQEAREEVRAERDRYTEARRDRRVLEKLREKGRADHETRSARKEQSEMDEIAGRRRTEGRNR
ncbi:MAG: flagellar export protein FliJ [Candidatus Eisenbacteria bacterium]|nr:flagellar export protein FliJ [Candidatus Latescibacterota bacterium]MBD3303253.1 flagellar export protein FliJ [Candidatus Eisenbacteria bacterium]